MIKRFGLNVLIIVSIIALAGIFYLNRSDNKAYSAWLKEQNIHLEKDDIKEEKKDNIKEEKVEEKDDVSVQEPTELNSKIFLAFTRLDKTFSEKIVPMMEEYDHKGVLVFYPYKLPGMDGCISIEEFMAFVEDGWDYVIGWDGNGTLEDAIYEANAFFREVGVPSPKKVYFKEGYYDAYDESITSVLKDYAVDTIIQHGENDAYPVVTSENNIDGKYVYGATSFKDEKLDDILQENLEVEGKIVVTVSDVSKNDKMDLFHDLLEKTKHFGEIQSKF